MSSHGSYMFMFLFMLISTLQVSSTTFDTPVVNCSDAIALVDTLLNGQCADNCRLGYLDPTECVYEHVDEDESGFTINEEVSCFHQYNYIGWDPYGPEDRPTYLRPNNATTIPECSQSCQVMTCASWLLTLEHECYTVTNQVKEGVLWNQLQDPSAPINNYCTERIADECRSGDLECESCAGQLRCAWIDKRIISGNYLCFPGGIEDCSLPTTTEAPTTTTTTTPPTTTAASDTSEQATDLIPTGKQSTTAKHSPTPLPPSFDHHSSNVGPIFLGVAGGAAAIGGVAFIIRRCTRGAADVADDTRQEPAYEVQVHDVNAEDYL